MSKILKIFVNLVVLIAIIIAAALLVPPFVGVDTLMNDNTETETNLPVGSVAYGKTVSVRNLEKSDKIIYNEGSSAYVYEITDMDTSAGTYKVKDVYQTNSQETTVSLQKTIPKVVVVVPLIGYAAIALQSREGLIIIGLGIVFLVILFILSELWRKDREEDEEDEEDGDEDEDEDDEPEEEKLSFRERRRLKKEEKRRLREEEYEEEYEDDGEEDEEELSFRERRRRKKEEKRRRKLEKKGLLDEEEEDFPEEKAFLEKESGQNNQEPELQGFDEAMKDAMSSIAMGVAKVSEPEQVPDATVVMPDLEELKAAPEQTVLQSAGEQPEAFSQEAREAEVSSVNPEEKTEETDINIEGTEIIETAEAEEGAAEEPVNVNAVPKAPTVQELLAKAQAAGEEPEIKTDDENDITLLDYSDIL